MELRLRCLALVFVSLQAFSQHDSTAFATPDTVGDPALTALSPADNDAESEAAEQAPLLTAGKDVFFRFAGFTFGQGFYRLRALDAKQQQVLINQVPVNELGTGSFHQGYRSGLPDAMRYPDAAVGICSNDYGFSGALGYAAYDLTAAAQRKGSRGSLAASNQLFATRWTLSHASGELAHGWAYALWGAGRYGRQYQPGTFIVANAVAMAVSRRLRDRHFFDFTFLTSALERGTAALQVKETAHLTGDPYYNPSWGFQGGKSRNAALQSGQRPLLIASYTYRPGTELWVSGGLALSSGGTQRTGLNWYQAANPRPDHYSKLPSYFSGEAATVQEAVAAGWSDLNTRQIDWDHLILLNKANLYSLPTETAQPNYTQTRSRYILESRVEKTRSWGGVASLHRRLGRVTLSAGVYLSAQTTRHYKEVNDLLGGHFWLDYDQFAKQQFAYPLAEQNNLEAPDKKLNAGDRFGYDYTLHSRKISAWGQGEYTGKNSSAFFSFELNAQRCWREGHVTNGKFPTDSKGRGAVVRHTLPSVRAGVTRHLYRHHYLSAGIFAGLGFPPAQVLFVSPEVRSTRTPGVKPEGTLVTELNYIVHSSSWHCRFTGWSYLQRGLTRLYNYWYDAAESFVNYAVTGINCRSYGWELGIEKTFGTQHTAQLAVGWSDSRYANRPNAQAWQNNQAGPIFSERTLYLRNYYLGGSPQTVAGCSYRFAPNARWQLSLTAALFDRCYVTLHPDRRSEEALAPLTAADTEQVEAILNQERLPAYGVLGSYLARSFRFRRHSVNLFVSANNLLGTQSIIARGAEQLRRDPHYPDRFATRYAWLPGRTWLAGAAVNF